jgi:hypothetical protein
VTDDELRRFSRRRRRRRKHTGDHPRVPRTPDVAGGSTEPTG